MPTKKLDLTATTGIKTTGIRTTGIRTAGIRTAGIKPSAATIKLNSTPAPAAEAAPAPETAPAPAPAAEADEEQTRTVVINRKKVTPAEPAPAATPLVAKAAPAGPLGTNTPNLNNITAGGKTIRLGTAPAPAAAPAGNNAQTQTASVKINGIPSPASSSIKLGASPTSTVQGTSSGIKLGTVSNTQSLKLGGPNSGAPGASKLSIKLGGTNGGASTQSLKLAPNGAPGASNPSIKLGRTGGASTQSLKLAPAGASTQSLQPSESPDAANPSGTAENPNNQASQTPEIPGGLTLKKPEESPAPVDVQEIAEEMSEPDDIEEQAKKAEELAKAKMEPNILFSITSIAALLAVIVLAAVVATQYLNHWEDMNIQLPGLTYLTLNK